MRLLHVFAVPVLFLATLLLFSVGLKAEDMEAKITNDEVTKLVAQTCVDLQKDAPATLAAINKGQAPYKDAANPTLYVFVYDLEVKLVAHPKPELVGKSMKGKPDLKGHKFRDEIVEKAQKESKGWTYYMYQKPGETGMFEKATYCEFIKGSDGAPYVVCSGKYSDKK